MIQIRNFKHLVTVAVVCAFTGPHLQSASRGSSSIGNVQAQSRRNVFNFINAFLKGITGKNYYLGIPASSRSPKLARTRTLPDVRGVSNPVVVLICATTPVPPTVTTS